MLKLKIEDGITLELDPEIYNAITKKLELYSVFEGTAAIQIDPKTEKGVNQKEMIFDIPIEENIKEKYPNYKRILSAEWDFAKQENNFLKYVERLMNKYSIENPYWCYHLMQHGCQSGLVAELIYDTDCHRILAEYSYDIEEIVQIIGESFGDQINILKASEFSFYKLIWLCFEETVRSILYNLELEDI